MSMQMIYAVGNKIRHSAVRAGPEVPVTLGGLIASQSERWSTIEQGNSTQAGVAACECVSGSNACYARPDDNHIIFVMCFYYRVLRGNDF